MLIPVAICAQENNEKQLTKYEALISKTGRILKYEDINLTSIPTMGFSIQTYIRIVRGFPNTYFLGLTSSAGSAMIEYSDLMEINKALVKLHSEQETDKEKKTDYLMNEFVTYDGFNIGYYIKKKSPHWFMKFDRLINNTINVEKSEPMIDVFKQAQAKIEELLKQE